MITVGASKPRTDSPSFSTASRRASGVQITRHGKVVATLVGEESERKKAAEAALERIQKRAEELQKTIDPPITTEEILGWIRDGRR
ncbi:MAG: hypothetical protein ABWZ80_00325 [Beijerinckiaceae bacterium]